jgi:hypothetical protein
MVERILLETRGHNQHRRTIGDDRRQRGEMGQRGAVRPMQIFNRKDARLPAA